MERTIEEKIAYAKEKSFANFENSIEKLSAYAGHSKECMEAQSYNRRFRWGSSPR